MPTSTPEQLRSFASLLTPENVAKAAAKLKTQGTTTPSVLSSVNGQKTVQDITKTVSDATASLPRQSLPDLSTGKLPPELQSEYDSLVSQKNDAITSLTSSYDNLALANTAATNSLISNIKSTWDSTRAQLEQANKVNEALFTQSGIRSGQARYAPELNQQILTQEAQAGASKLRSLDSQYTSLISQAQDALSQKNFTLAKEKSDKILEIRQKALDEFNKQAEAATKIYQASREKLIQSTRDSAVAGLVQQGITDPAELLNYLNFDQSGNQVGDFTAKEIGDAVSNLIKNQTYPGGIVGEYQFYSDQERKLGRAPMDFNSYQNLDANRKVSIARAGVGSTGLDSGTLTKVMSVAGQFDNEQSVKNYQAIAESIASIKTAGNSPTDDISRVYAFAKVMDPNSVVREGEYNTVQAYSTALFQRYGLKARRVFSNTGFLTPEARTFMLTTLNNRLNASSANYKNIYNEYGRRINKITGGTDGTDYITSYSSGFPTADSPGMDSKNTVDSYILNHPEDAETVAKLYEVEGVTDESIVEWLQLHQKI